MNEVRIIVFSVAIVALIHFGLDWFLSRRRPAAPERHGHVSDDPQ